MGEPTQKMRIYEAVFLVETAKGRRDEDVTVGELSDLVQKRGAKVINGAKWLDRDLAYPIHKLHQKFTRGVYFLFHLSAPPDAIGAIERDVQISDWIIRALITRDEDGVTNPGADAARKERAERKDGGDAGWDKSRGDKEAAPAPASSEEGDD